MNSLLFNLPRPAKKLISVLSDCVFITIAFFAALAARWESIFVVYNPEYWMLLGLTGLFILAVLERLGLYRSMLRYMNSQVIWTVLLAAVCAVLAIISFSFYLQILIPRSVPFLFAALMVLLVGGSRLLFRALMDEGLMQKKEGVIVYGAGAGGRQLATALSHGDEFSIVAFIDDDPKKQGQLIQGKQTYSRSKLGELLKKHSVKKVLIALPSITDQNRQFILAYLEPFNVQVLITPSIQDIVAGKASLEQFKEVDIDDLLGRSAVKPNAELLSKNIKGKTVLVTGAGGSIGSELCRQILTQSPQLIILLDASEFALYSIDKDLNDAKRANQQYASVPVVPLIGRVQNKERMTAILKTYQVDTIYHAAAYKHVPLVEKNVAEGVRNNVFGTLTLAQAAIEHHVTDFVLISTDKAVRPTNVMGASKRMAELVLQALNAHQSQTKFCMVRFGNVLGSSGSVVPLFREQIKNGGPVTVTHKDITRYFMTIPEAAQLVIQAGAMAKGGDVFVLDMGEPVRIVDLAVRMIRFSGLEVKTEHNPTGHIEIQVTGLRPGEKLFEELLIGKNVQQTEHRKIMTAQERMLPWPQLKLLLNKLDEACKDTDQIEIRHALLEAPTDFSPTDEINDLVWSEANKELAELLIAAMETTKMEEEFAEQLDRDSDVQLLA